MLHFTQWCVAAPERFSHLWPSWRGVCIEMFLRVCFDPYRSVAGDPSPTGGEKKLFNESVYKGYLAPRWSAFAGRERGRYAQKRARVLPAH